MKEVANPFEGTGIDPKKAYVGKYKGDVSKLKEVSDPFAKPVEKESIGNKILKITSPFRQIAGGVASSVGTFGAKAVGSALKGGEYIGEKLGQAQEKIFGLDQAVTPSPLKGLGQRTVERATQAEGTIQKKFGQDIQGKPLTEISKGITDIAQTVAIGPKAPTFGKAGISTIGKVFSKEGAKQVGRAALQGAAEGAIYSAGAEGKVDPTTVGVSAGLEAAFPVVGLGVKAATKGAGTFFTRTLPISRIEKSLGLTPTERSIVENTGETAAQFVLRKNIGGLPKEAQINKLQEIADEGYNTLTKQVAGIKTKSGSETAKKMLGTMVDEMKKSDIVARERGPYIKKLQEMIDQGEYSVAEKLAIKRDFDRIVGRQIFNKVGRVSGEEDKILAGWRNKLGNEIEKDAIKHGVDVKGLNTDVRNSITIRDGLLRRLSQENKNNTFSLQDIGVGAILSAGEPIAATALIIGKKVLEKSAPGVMQGLYNLNKAKNVFTNLRRGASFAARDTSDGLSITPSSVAGSTATGVKPGQESGKLFRADPGMYKENKNMILGIKDNKPEPRLLSAAKPSDFSTGLVKEAKKYKSFDDFVGAKMGREYKMSHRPSEGVRSYDLIEKVDGEQMIPKNMYEVWHGSRGTREDLESIAVLKRIKGNPEAEVTIYRASPSKDFNYGDWVTFSPSYAKLHAERNGGSITSKVVKAKDVKWAMDDINEFGYYPEGYKEQLRKIREEANK